MDGTILYTEDAGNTWEMQDSGTEQYLTSIFFINEKTGWIVGTKGTILHTDDGGKKWVSQDSGSINPLHKVFFITSQEGWIVGNDVNKDEGFLLYTKDGGKKWEKHTFEQRLTIASIFFIDSNTGWFLAGDKVFRTKDSGKNWDYSLLPIPDSERRFLRGGIPKIGGGWKGDIFFADAKKGWAVIGAWYIFSTEDGGETWKAQFAGEKMSYGLGHFFFADAKKGCVGGSTIFCIEDGLSWKEQLGVRPMGRKDWFDGFIVELWGGDFVDKDIGWAVGPYGLIMKTEDGGKNWGIKTRVIEGIMTFVNNKVGWSSKDGTILYTDDGGNTWKVKVEMKDLITIRRFFVFNQLERLAIGYIKPKVKDEGIHRVRVLKTIDGGKTWITQNESIIHSPERFTDVYFIDFNNGWFIGERGVIFHTEDGGKNWKRQKSGTELYLHGVHFIDTKRGWVIGDSGLRGYIEEDDPQPEGIILYTEDSGEHWHTQWTKKGKWLNGIFFVDSNKGWVTGDNGLLLSTEDRGRSWLEKKIAKESLDGPVFIDANSGWIYLLDWEDNVMAGILLITEDGGKTWVKQKTGLHKYPWRPFMEDNKTLPK